VHRELGQSGRLAGRDVAFRRPDGKLVEVSIAAERVMHEGRAAVITGFLDITSRRDTERVLRERERLLSSINANLAGTCVYRMVYGAGGHMTCTYA